MSERAERQFFGGESLDSYGKKLEEAEKAMEVMPYGELMTKVGEQMVRVVETLEKERALAAEIREMGGKITPETAVQIKALEKQKNDLLKVYESTLEPVRKEAAEAHIEGADWLVEKPKELEAMMTDPDTMEVADEDLIEVQTVEDLRAKEQQLQGELDKSQEQMAGLIESMHAANNEAPKSLRDALRPPDPELHRAYLAVLEAQFGDLHNYVRTLNDKLKEVRTNLGFAEKMEGKKAA